MNNYLTPLKSEFDKSSNESNAKAMNKYMKDKFEFVGIPSKHRTMIFQNFIKQYGLPDYHVLPEIIDDMWNAKHRDYQYCAVELANKFRKHWQEDMIYMFEDLLVRKSWWDSVDYIINRLNSPYFKKYPDKFYPITHKWNKSENMWLQRASILSQLKFKQVTNEIILSDYILNCTHSKEFFIQKAIGWALREYSKTNPDFVLNFIENNDLKALSKREGLRWINSRVY